MKRITMCFIIVGSILLATSCTKTEVIAEIVDEQLTNGVTNQTTTDKLNEQEFIRDTETMTPEIAPDPEPEPTPAPEPEDDTQYEAVCYFIDKSNSIGVKVHTDKYTGWMWDLEDVSSENAPREMTIEFDGASYTGRKSYSTYDRYNTYVTDYYRVKDSELEEFGVKSGTDEIVRLSFVTKSRQRKAASMEVLSEEECAQIADRYAAMFIPLDGYVRTEPTMRGDHGRDDYDPHDITYTFSYYKPINGQISSDTVSVRVYSTGLLAQITVGDLGVFDTVSGAQLRALLDFNIEDAVAERLKRSTESEYYDLIDFELREVYYVITPDGHPMAIVRSIGHYELSEERIPKDDKDFNLERTMNCGFSFYICVEEKDG